MRRSSLIVTALAAMAVTARADTDECEQPVPIFADGVEVGVTCATRPRGDLTIVDLSATWTPAALAPGPEGDAPAYRALYLALADGRLADAGDEGTYATYDRHVEIYGIVPALSVIGAWLDDDARHRCHAQIDGSALLRLTGSPRQESVARAAQRLRDVKRQRAVLEAEARRRHVEDLDALAAVSASLRRRVTRLRDAETYVLALGAAQAHLACDGLDGADEARFGWRTGVSLAAFQRRNLFVPRGRLDAETRAALVEDSRERDFRAALRALRERVITATGLIEDGSAGAGNATVLGRRLDPPAFDHALGHAPLPGAAPDRIAAATEAAALALGWTDPAATARALRTLPPRVALRLPPLPDRTGQALVAEVDRGDVWYDAHPTPHRVDRRPALILYAVDGATRTPLIRWPTTIGGWQKEKLASGAVVQRWKESPVGPRVWRELYLGPTWLPPPSTPDAELVYEVRPDQWALTRALVGPSYRSAYGLAMLVHERVGRDRRGAPTYGDQGVRTHGSVGVASIHDGHSHGCHRLLPVQALRLASFLVQHHPHRRDGEIATRYARTVRHHGRFALRITTRGYRIELTPPIPVEVLPGRIRSRRTSPAR